MIPASFNPRPVSVTTPTMMPEAAHTATTGSTPMAPAASASHSRRGVSRCSRSRKLSPKASSVDRTTARNGVMPSTMKMTIANSELK
jgi:hypothetical protein